MTEVPVWLAIATPIVAILGLIVATISLMTARASLRTAQETYARGGPLIVGEASMYYRHPAQWAILDVKIRNAGLAPVDVDRITLQYTLPKDPKARPVRPARSTAPRRPPGYAGDDGGERARRLGQEDLPKRIEPGSSVNWEFELDGLDWNAKAELMKLADIPRLKWRSSHGAIAIVTIDAEPLVEVLLGNGEKAVVQVRTPETTSLIPSDEDGGEWMSAVNRLE